jgi:ubiquinone/menaquinone biosynthesis C-methylase UbiE
LAAKHSKSSSRGGYLHGYSPREQDRLYHQARFLEGSVYEQVDFHKQTQVIEVGCGVGAQTEILLERFPGLKVHGVDASSDQLKRAKAHLSKAVRAGRVSLSQANAETLPFDENAFDGAFLCWFLEHVEKPVEVLREARRVLRTGGVIYCTEPMNAGFYLHPYSPATLQFYFAYNDYQWTLKGDPFVGGKLGNYLLAAGFQNVTSRVIVHHMDNRTPKRRAEYIEYTSDVLLSGAPGLVKAGKVTPELVKDMRSELERLKHEPDAVFFDVVVQARAQAF